MREEILRKAYESVMGPSSRGEPLPKGGTKGLFHSGTTIVGVRYADGVICGGDRQTTSGWSVLSDNATKVQQVGMFSVMGAAGLVSAIQYVQKEIRERNANFFGRAGMPLSLAGQANFLSMLIRGLLLADVNEDFHTRVILAGREIGGGGYDIYEIDGAGGQYQRDYCSIGSGGDSALPILKDRRQGWRPKMRYKEALDLAFRAIFSAGKLDVMTGDSEVVLPVIAVIDRNGFRYVTERELKRVRDKYLKEGLK